MERTIVMPKLGLSMEEGTIIQWYKTEGDMIKKGEQLFTVETEKMTNDIECEFPCILKKVLVAAGDEAKCGEAVAVVEMLDDGVSPG